MNLAQWYLPRLYCLTNYENTDFADYKVIFSYGIYCILLAQNSSFVCFELPLFCFIGGQDAVTVVGYPLGGDTISVTKGVVSRIEVWFTFPIKLKLYANYQVVYSLCQHVFKQLYSIEFHQCYLLRSHHMLMGHLNCWAFKLMRQ